MSSDIDHLRVFLEDLRRESLYFGGGQVYASVAGETVIDLAFGSDGLGRAFELDSLSSIYCAGKPLLALVVGHHVASNKLSFATQVGELIELRPDSPLASVTVRDLLTHSAGLHLFRAVDAVLTPGSSIDAAISQMQPVPGFRVGRDTAYAEYAGWHLLARLCEAVDRRDYRDQIQELVVEPFEVNDELVVSKDGPEWERLFDRVRVNESFRGGERFPMLLERTAMWSNRWNPAFGVRGCARGLGHFYEQLQLFLANGKGDGWSLEYITGYATTPTYDLTLGRACSYSLGFMRDLASHEFGDMWSPTSIGHSGNVGMTAAGVDLSKQFVVAFHLSGLTDGESAVDYLRPVIMARIWRCIAALDA